MEKRKETLSNIKACRFCLNAEELLIPLYDNKVRPKNTVPLALKILSCIAIEIFPSDNMPQFICQRCKLFMELSYTFKQICRKADETILQFIQNGVPLTPLPWPSQLSKAFKSVNKSTEVNVVKTVVQGGATVKVMAEEISDSEEGEDDSVYNVKIGDGSDEGKSIKIITTVDQSKSPKGRQGTSRKFASVAKLTRHVREHAGQRPYPCKHCDKSFTKSHHYTRHLRVKHADTTRVAGAYSEAEAYRCDECEETFATQDDLMYHSALHATRNLVCPLCQEKFDDVDTVTAHIKSHVNGTEFMCDYCELIFTSKEKLDDHIARAHDDEFIANDQETEPDESSMDMDAEDDDDNLINVKEENGEMVVEIKKADEYMLPAVQAEEDKGDNTLSEDSDMNYAESPVTELSTTPVTKQEVVAKKEVTITKVPVPAPKPPPAPAAKPVPAPVTKVLTATNSTTILRKAEILKRKAVVVQRQQPPAVADKKDKPVKVETSSVTGASDKSLRLLEKELQDLKRTNSRTEAAKTPISAKNIEPLRNRRPQMFSSTPKPRTVDKKEIVTPKSTPERIAQEKKLLDRKGKDSKEPKEVKSNNNTIREDKELKVIKEEKEPKGNKEEKESKANKEEKEPKANKEEKESKTNKEEKESKTNKEDKESKVNKEEKEPKGNSKEDKVKEDKKENAKAVVKNGASESPASIEEPVRRSSRPSKFKDYAKMIRDSSMDSEDDDTDADDFEENFVEPEKTPEQTPKVRGRRNSKPAAAPTPPVRSAAPPAPAATPRKRGRPRKELTPVVPSKVKKDAPSEEEEDTLAMKDVSKHAPQENQPDNGADGTKTPEANKLPQEPRPGVIISPSGQTLKKVPIKALPPGVKPLPLPVNSRLGGGEVTEMQIGKKIVKVQKIVMTKAEVEAMTKKGLLEIKDGTMVLKQGIKLPAADAAIKPNPVAEEANKESQKPAPTRCDLD